MRKFIVIFLFLLTLILSVGVYYYYSENNTPQPATLKSIEQCIPQDAVVVLKVDLSNYKFTLLKEIMTLDESLKDSSSLTTNPLIEFTKEVVKKAGGGIALFQPVYLYQNTDEKWGAFIYLADKITFDSLLHQSDQITLLNDSVSQIKNSEWEIKINNTFLHIYSNLNLNQNNSDSLVWDLKPINAQTSLISGMIKTKEGVIYAAIDYKKDTWSIKAKLPLNNHLAVGEGLNQKLVDNDKSYLDIFISDPKSPYLGYIGRTSTITQELLNQIKRPVHIQYLGNQTTTEKYITYDYNDDFEMVEVTKTQRIEKELLNGLFLVQSIKEAEQLKNDYKPFFTQFQVSNSTIIASHQKINKELVEASDSLYAQVLIHDLENQLPKQLQEILGNKTIKLPFKKVELYAYKNDSINVVAEIKMKNEYKHLFDLIKLIAIKN